MAYRLTAPSLGLRVYSGNSETLRVDPYRLLSRAYGPEFKTYYPGGRYGEASFFIPVKITRTLPINEGDRVVLSLGLLDVYEGFVSSLDLIAAEDGQGYYVKALGGWGWTMMSYPIRKPWCDTRLEESVWIWAETLSAADKCTIDRNNQLKFVPKNVSWANDDTAAAFITVPTGETIKRVTFDYGFAEGAQSWRFGLQTATSTGTGSGTPHWEITADGTGSGDETLGEPAQRVRFFFHNNSGGAQTPAADGSIYGQVDNVKVYTETGTITMTSILQNLANIIATAGYLNAETAFIQTPGTTLTLEPFIVEDFQSAADVVDLAVGKGDGANNRWAAGLYGSWYTDSPDGQPVLFLEQYPDLTDYELTVRMDEINFGPSLKLTRDADISANWIVVRYTDENGYTQYLTPDDDSTLTDSTAVAKISSTRFMLVDIGDGTSALAADIGAQYLSRYKDLLWRLSQGVEIRGYIREKGGGRRHVSQVYGGLRIRIENFINDLSGTGFIFVVTATAYDHLSQTVKVQAGLPTSPIFQSYSHPTRVDLPEETAPAASESSPSGGGRVKWWKIFGMKRRDWFRLSGRRKRELKLEWERGWWRNGRYVGP